MVVIAATSLAKLTPHGKKLISDSMREKGKAFIAAAMLLRKQGGNEYVVLYLLCQGIEVLGKGYLLLVDYDTYKPKLRKYGHNLIALVSDIEKAANISILNNAIRVELQVLSNLYREQLLRYGSGYDILVNPATIPSKQVLRRVVALLLFSNRKKVAI